MSALSNSDAMRRLNLTRCFCGSYWRQTPCLDTWLLPEGSQETRMPEVVQRFVTEIVENEACWRICAELARWFIADRIARDGNTNRLCRAVMRLVEELVRIGI